METAVRFTGTVISSELPLALSSLLIKFFVNV